MKEWIRQVKLPDNQPAISLRAQLQAWRIPRRIQGQLRQQRRVLINGYYQNMTTILKANDEISLQFKFSDFVTPTSNYVADDHESIDVLYENQDVLVVNKRSGIKTHPNSPGETGTLMNFVQAYLRPNALADAYMVHRLDEDTSGAILVAKTPIAVTILNAYLKDKTIKRQYLALVEGCLAQKAGTIDLPIGINPDNERLRMVNGCHAQPAITHWQVRTYYENMTLVQLNLETGRTHQIRVHLNALGHAIVGDTYYNATHAISLPLMLHGEMIEFVKPFSNITERVWAPLPSRFKEIV